MKPLPVGRTQNGATACREHTVLPLGELIDHRFLDVPESVFTLALEKLPDGATQTMLDHMVGISKRK